jgi:hypothetical protein
MNGGLLRCRACFQKSSSYPEGGASHRTLGCTSRARSLYPLFGYLLLHRRSPGPSTDALCESRFGGLLTGAASSAVVPIVAS